MIIMRNKVRAAVMVRPGKIELQEFPYPKIPADSALVKMEMSGICGTDKHMYKGETTHPGQIESAFPIIPGHENVGVIEELGQEAKSLEVEGKSLQPQDRIVPVCDVVCGECYVCRTSFGFTASCERDRGYGTTISCKDPPHLFGGWSEYMYILPKAMLAKVPDGVPPESAVLTEVMSVPYCGFEKAMSPYAIGKEGFGPRDTVVVLGSGPLGVCHGIMAKIAGAEKVIIVGAPESRLQLARKLCADQVLNIENLNPDERLQEILDLTDNRGADLVAECAGIPEAVSQGLDMLRIGGTLLVAGNYIDMGPTNINPQRQILSKNVRIIGVNGQTASSYCASLRLIKKFQSEIQFSDMITHKFKIDEAEKALKTAMTMNSLEVAIIP